MQIHTNHLQQGANSPVNQTLTGVYEIPWDEMRWHQWCFRSLMTANLSPSHLIGLELQEWLSAFNSKRSNKGGMSVWWCLGLKGLVWSVSGNLHLGGISVERTFRGMLVFYDRHWWNDRGLVTLGITGRIKHLLLHISQCFHWLIRLFCGLQPSSCFTQWSFHTKVGLMWKMDQEQTHMTGLMSHGEVRPSIWAWQWT